MKETLKWAIKQRDKVQRNFEKAVKEDRPNKDLMSLAKKDFHWATIIEALEDMEDE